MYPTTFPQPPLDRLRVTVVQQGGVLGGAERWQLQLADATDRLEVDVVGIGAGATSREWAARGWRVTTVPDARTPRRLLRLVPQVMTALRRRRPDVVVAHGVKAALVAAPAARALGIPVVWVRHDASFSGRVVGLLDRLTDAQVTTSAWLLQGRAPRRSLVLNPPRMPEPLPREVARAELDVLLEPGELLVGMATRITRNKGIEEAVRALAEPAASCWVLAVAGIHDASEPDEQDRLVKLAAELGVSDRVRFLGEVPDFSRVASAFDAIAVLTRPSPELPWYREAFGMAALEAMTAGVPVIAVPPVDELVRGGGLAVEPGSAHDVAAALGVLTVPAAHRVVAEAAAERARDFADATTSASALVDFLARLADRPGAGHRPGPEAGPSAGAAPGPALSVVTTVLDDAAALTDLLTGLVPQLGPDDELVVVDGGSSDGTGSVAFRAAEADPRVRFLSEPGAGISRGRNLGIESARHELIACTDAGCVPVPGWLDAFRRAFDRHPDVDLWTGTYRVLGEKPWELALIATGYPSIEELGRRTPFVRAYGRFLGRVFDASMPTGRSVAFTRDAWRAAEGFPEHLPTGEDVLFGRAVVASGRTAALARDAEVRWAQRPTLRANLRMLKRYGEGSGNSLDARLMGRDLARLGAYAGWAGLALRGGRGRGVAAATAAVYLSMPVARAVRGPRPVVTTLLVPPVAAARDLAKVEGALSAVLGRRGRRHREGGSA